MNSSSTTSEVTDQPAPKPLHDLGMYTIRTGNQGIDVPRLRMYLTEKHGSNFIIGPRTFASNPRFCSIELWLPQMPLKSELNQFLYDLGNFEDGGEERMSRRRARSCWSPFVLILDSSAMGWGMNHRVGNIDGCFSIAWILLVLVNNQILEAGWIGNVERYLCGVEWSERASVENLITPAKYRCYPKPNQLWIREYSLSYFTWTFLSR